MARRETALAEVQRKVEAIYADVKSSDAPIVSTHILDVAQKAAWQPIIDEVLAKHQQIDVLFNNAGYGGNANVFEVTEEEFDSQFGINTKGALWGMQTIVPYFKQRGVGHIINTSSCLGRIPLVLYMASYNAAKHALNAYTAAARQQLASEGYGGIVVSTFSPGAVANDFGLHSGTGDNRKIPHAQDLHEVATKIVEQIGAGKIAVEAEVQRVATTPDAKYTDAVFPPENPILYDYYSRDSYKGWVTSYYAANDISVWERNLVAQRAKQE